MSALDATNSTCHGGFAGTALPTKGSLWTVMRRMWIAISTRNQLAELDDRMLHDLGISRADVEREIARAAWDTEPIRRGDRPI